MLILGGTQIYNQSFPLQIVFFPVLCQLSSFKIQQGKPLENYWICPLVCVFLTPCSTLGYGHHLGHISVYERSKLAQPPKWSALLCPSQLFPSCQHKHEFSCIPGCNFIDSWTLKGRNHSEWFSISLPSVQKPKECLPRHKGGNFHCHLEAVGDPFALCNHYYE